MTLQDPEVHNNCSQNVSRGGPAKVALGAVRGWLIKTSVVFRGDETQIDSISAVSADDSHSSITLLSPPPLREFRSPFPS